MRSPGDGAPRQSRRQFLRGAGGLAGAAALGGGALAIERLLGVSSPPPLAAILAAAPPSPDRNFHSRPDLHPPALSVAGRGDLGPGYLFLGPGAVGKTQAGPLIADGDGEPVWFRPLSGAWLANFRAWSHLGEQVLAWWQGVVILPTGYGRGHGVIVDQAYRERARIHAARGRTIDMHELRLTPEGTALFTCYPRAVRADLSAIGGPRKGRVLESIFQEVDVRTGRLLLEWRSLDHVPVEESYRPLEEPYDYLHLNSIDVAPDGNLLVSGRHTWALYKLDRRTGEVIWRLGGRRTDFDVPADARFTWQHDAEHAGPQILTVFDNGTDGRTRSESSSRGMVLRVDERARTVRLVRAYERPQSLQASAMGSVQILPGGEVLVGWGDDPHTSQFTADGRLVADIRMAPHQQSYRAYRLPWTAHPHQPPTIRIARDARTGSAVAYASWNGATELSHWRLEAGSSRSELHPVGVVAREGFETQIPLGPAHHRYLAATALDAAGRRLGRSAAVRI